MNIDKLFNNDLKEYASYDNVRSIASSIDGFKNSGRKVIYFSSDLNNYKKVSILKSEIALKSQYLHNEDILNDIIVGFARDCDCSNYIPLFKPLSSVGSRIRPSAAQPRYSNVKKSEFYDLMFNKEDDEILEHQYFEGSKIEPRFLVPTLPLLLINGSNGMGVGFAQNVLPRSPKDIITAIKQILAGETPKPIKPDFKGYKGKIELLNTEFGKKQWKFTGIYEKINTYELIITETTPYETNETMLKKLNDLKEKKIIKDYKDFSEGDNFNYKINVAGDFWKNSNIHKLLGIETTDTENFTCATKDNFIKTYENEIEILKEYLDVKILYTQKRKDNILRKINIQLELASDEIKFIQAILDKKIILERKTKEEIIKQIKEIGIENNIDKLINMPLYSLSKESIESLQEKVKKISVKINELFNKTAIDIYIEDINNLSKV